jgi:tetratricopeptide (TPR) repeat protein
MTLRALSDKLGVSRPTIYAYVSGALQVPQTRLAQISAVTGKELAFFEPAISEDQSFDAYDRIRLIDALLSPPDPHAASQMATAVAERVEELDSPTDLARLLFRAGNALLQHGEYTDATQQLDQARRMFLSTGNLQAAATCSQSLGYCWINLGNLARARACFEFSSEHSEPAKRWAGEVSLAALAEREGEFGAAEAMLADIQDRAGLPPEAYAYVASNQANLLCTRGHWTAALGSIEEALALAYREQLPDQVAELIIQKGTALTLIGDFEGASLALVRAGDVCFSLHDEARTTLQELASGRLLASLGRLADARKTIVSAMSAATRGRYRRSEALALRLLAEIACARGDFDQAHDYAIQAISHCETHQYPAEAALAKVSLALAQSAAGQAEGAKETLEQVDSTAQAFDLGEIKARALRARAFLAWQMNCREAASDAWTEAAESATEMGLIPLAAQTLWEAGQRNAAAGYDEVGQAFADKARTLASNLLGQRVLLGPGAQFGQELASAAEWFGQACV